MSRVIASLTIIFSIFVLSYNCFDIQDVTSSRILNLESAELSSFKQCTCEQENDAQLPYIYAITPTRARLAQKADLIRLSQTLMHLKYFHWIVIEDAAVKSDLVENVLRESNLNYTHLYVTNPNVNTRKARGVEQRNLGLEWLRQYLAKKQDKRGVVFFMDDDNTYSLKLFDMMRKIKKVGIWPVGIVGGLRAEVPLVTDGKVTSFNAVWKPYRPFPVDMAGFAINATLFLDHPDAKFSRNVESGFQESEILRHFTSVKDLEPLADNCTKVHVWHTRTENPVLKSSKLPIQNMEI